VAVAMEGDHWIADIDHNLTALLIDDFVNLLTRREAELNLNTEDPDSITWRYRGCLLPEKICKVFKIPRHIESYGTCMEH